MSKIEKKKPDEYKKQHSFDMFSSKRTGVIESQTKRSLAILSKKENIKPEYSEVLLRAEADLQNTAHSDSPLFKITQFIGEEMETIDDADLPRYLFHRYRYDIYPLTQKLDAYPPYLQIEPSSICNFKCVFCYQTDPTYNSKASGHLGTMPIDTFKRIVDQIVGNVEFISLASRGEPLVAKDFGKMMEYTAGKFLGLKMNTNASLMTEAHAHSILSGGIKTVVFSADAAEEPLYGQLRVNGSLDKTIKNIRMFQDIRNKHYSRTKILTRVSGVKVSENQTMDSMVGFWGNEVDQVAFVKYNPWENTYTAPINGVNTACSDLWRRMFVWFDGLTNPCDSDYKSHLAVGNVNESNVSELWNSDKYNILRKAHGCGNRQKLDPCRRCFVT